MALNIDTIIFGSKAKYVMPDSTIIGIITEIRSGFSLGLGDYKAYTVWDPRRNIYWKNCIWYLDPFLNIYRRQTGTTIYWDYYIEDAVVVIDNWRRDLALVVQRLNKLKQLANSLGIIYV